MNRRIGDKDTASCLGGLCSLYLYFCVCISVFVFVCLYWCVCICVCVCLCLYLCLYLCVCICVFVFGPVNRRRGLTFQPGGSLLPLLMLLPVQCAPCSETYIEYRDDQNGVGFVETERRNDEVHLMVSGESTSFVKYNWSCVHLMCVLCVSCVCPVCVLCVSCVCPVCVLCVSCVRPVCILYVSCVCLVCVLSQDSCVCLVCVLR